MPKNATRKLVDKQGNIYCVEIPHDVNPESLEDIMVGIHEGIVKLTAYRLAGDVYRDPGNVECASGGKEFSFYKKLNVFDAAPDLDQNEFGMAIQELLEQARNYRINRMEIKSYEGKPVLKDAKGYYLKRAYLCVAEGCNHLIEGEQRLSMRDGVITRAQMFEPYDKGATRVRQGSKSWFCPSCSPKSVPLPEPAPPAQEEPVPVPVPESAPELPNLVPEGPIIKEKASVLPRSDDDLRELLRLSEWKSDVPLEWFKGFVYGVMKARMK